MIKFSVTRLEKEPIELIGDEPPEWLELGPTEQFTVSAPVHYDLLAKAVSAGALVEGKVRTKLSGNCGRCLEPVVNEVENSGVCLFFELPETDELDISEDVRAELLLELPMNLICSDDCHGLCPRCGANLNMTTCDCEDETEEGKENSGEDNRWSALDDLKL